MLNQHSHPDSKGRARAAVVGPRSLFLQKKAEKYVASIERRKRLLSMGQHKVEPTEVER
jgi:hypothetical protein